MADIGLIRRAVREKWPVASEIRHEVVEGLSAALENDTLSGREVCRLARCLFAMDVASLLTERAAFEGSVQRMSIQAKP